MDAFMKILQKYDLQNSDCLSRSKLTTLQVNMGNVCNQNCLHCHVDASPQGKNIMSREVVDDILGFLSRYKITTLDSTGGAPEMNPHFEYFIKNAHSLVDEVIVRSNLTILEEKGKEHLPELYKELKVRLVCSLPCYQEANVDSQRGAHVFEKSISALKKLNAMGFAQNEKLILDLVYNPVGANLPPCQEQLEKDYKKVLSQEQGVHFNRLMTITNVPIKRYKKFLETKGEYEEYCALLKDNFNPDVLQGIMCRTFISVGFDGKLYDCDFNQALGLALKDDQGKDLIIKNLNADDLEGAEILMGEHCLSCTAGSGSSCQGALASESDETKGKG